MVAGPRFDHAAYDAVLFIDSMIPLEGRPLPELPWAELGLGDKVLLLVVPQVLQEVDKRKRDGRLGKRAREFRRLVEPAALAGRPIRLVDGPPSVDLALAPSSRIAWDELDDLDPDEGDAKVVAQILYERGVPHERKVLFSQDMLPIALASGRGLTVRRFPDEWLAPSEPSPHDKELTRLKARVRELETAEPKLEADLAFGVAAPVELPLVEPLSREEQEELDDHLRRANPQQLQANPGRIAHVYGSDTQYDGKYADYLNKKVPAYTANLHKLVQDYHAQVPLRLTISNDGAVQAENLVVELRVKGGGLRERFLAHLLFGPTAPRVQDLSEFLIPNTPQFNPRDFRPPVIGRHEVVFAAAADGGNFVEIHCADFRHGWEWDWNGIAHLDPAIEEFTVEVTLTASNMKGKREVMFALPITSKRVRVADLLDPMNRKYLTRFPLQDRFEEALNRRDMDWLEFPKRE